LTNNEEQQTDEDVVAIKKYANRRLYNTATSSYVTLEDLAQMVRDGQNFVVTDAKSGDDITRSVLTQIIFELENKGQNLLPINFLRQLITYYGDSLQSFVPSYLDLSMDAFSQQQGKMREKVSSAFGGSERINMFEDQIRRNFSMFEEAMRMFSPFGAMGGPKGANPGSTAPPEPEPQPKPAPSANPTPAPADDNDLTLMRDQLSAMQKQLDKLAKKDD
jgi:polyhydroxyalkanoate synthesis repressor PhaR